MANTSIQLKKSGVSSNVPSGLNFGELAINYADGILYYKNANGSIASIVTGSGGESAYSFSTINANSTLVLATSGTDTLTLVGANGIGVTACSTTKTVTIDDSATYIIAQGAFDKANTALANTDGAVFQGQLNITGTLRALTQGGDEGGEIYLDKAATNTTLAGGVTIDVYQNKLRIFESAGSTRGVYIDLANNASNSVGTDLLNPGASPDSTARLQANGAFVQANGAFIQANAAFEVANNTLGVDATQNTNITVAGIQANGAFRDANSASSYANSAFIQANSSYRDANSASSYANSAFLTANNNSGVNLTQNNRITVTEIQANGAFIQANAAFAAANASGSAAASTYANGAFTQANAAFLTANSASSYANGAFTTANNRVLKAGDTITGILAISNTTSSNSNTRGALTVSGGIGVTGNIYLGSDSVLGFANVGPTSSSAVYVYFNETTNSLDTVFN